MVSCRDVLSVLWISDKNFSNDFPSQLRICDKVKNDSLPFILGDISPKRSHYNHNGFVVFRMRLFWVFEVAKCDAPILTFKCLWALRWSWWRGSRRLSHNSIISLVKWIFIVERLRRWWRFIVNVIWFCWTKRKG